MSRKVEEKENDKNIKEIRIALERGYLRIKTKKARFIFQFLEIGYQIDLLSFYLFVIYTNLSHEYRTTVLKILKRNLKNQQ